MRSLTSSFLLLGLLLLSTCTAIRQPAPDDFFIFTRVDIIAEYNANLTSPVPLDLVFVYDETFLAELQTMGAAQWFEWRESRADIPQEQVFWLSQEIAPGQNRSITNFPDNKNHSLALVIFADYQTDGLHREIVQTRRAISIRLNEEGFVVTRE